MTGVQGAVRGLEKCEHGMQALVHSRSARERVDGNRHDETYLWMHRPGTLISSYSKAICCASLLHAAVHMGIEAKTERASDEGPVSRTAGGLCSHKACRNSCAAETSVGGTAEHRPVVCEGGTRRRSVAPLGHARASRNVAGFCGKKERSGFGSESDPEMSGVASGQIRTV